MSFTGCTIQAAEDALRIHNGDVLAATDAIMPAPVISGAKHIPKPRIIDRGLTSEQEERCAMGRMLMDKLTAVSSAAQTKIQSGQQLAEDAVKPASGAPDEPQVMTVPVSET